MKKLVICEKPDVARNVVDALNQRENFNKKDGYYESNNYIVSWCFGHLFELKNVNDYEGEKVKWSDIKLPYIPQQFQYKVKNDNGVKKQFKILKEFINSDVIDGIYNCGDNDSEGQILIEEVLMACRNKKTTYRMILPDQTEKTVLKEIDRRTLNSEYRNFANEGFSRQRLDWLYGINTTVLLTVKTGQEEQLNCGRLIVPIVKKIYDVDMSIKNFIPTTYYQCESDVKGIKLTVSDKFEVSKIAEDLAEELNKEKAFVKEISSKDVNKKASKLFNLTKLQKYMNKNFKMKADEVLKICQSLYEKKYQTYPRTDSEYIREEEEEKIKEIIVSLNDPNLEFKDKKAIFDNSKVEAHSALTPTTIIPNDLTGKEKLVYDTVSNRFKANFCKEECIISTSEMIIECGNVEFKFKGEIMKQKGFTVYEPIANLKVLPKLNKGDIIEHDFKSVEKETQPPKKMTQATLLSYLENPFRNHEDDEEIEVKTLGLGTAATRAEIIKKCCLKYIEDNNNTLSITPTGIKFIEAIDKLGIDLYADKTITISKDLKSVRAGSMSLQECLSNAVKELSLICNKSKSIEIEKIENVKEEKEILGKCPRCQKNVYEGKSNYYCEGFKDTPKCDFSIWKEDKFFKDKGKKITKTMAKAFLKGERIKVSGLKKKDGTGTYSALISMIEKDFNGKKYINFNMSFK